MVSQALLRRLASSTLRRKPSVNPIFGNQNLYKSTAAIEHESETFLTGSSSLYAEQMYENYCQDPSSVHETWRKYFDDMEQGKSYDENAFNRPTVVISNQKKVGEANDSHLAVSKYHGKALELSLIITLLTLNCDCDRVLCLLIRLESHI